MCELKIQKRTSANTEMRFVFLFAVNDKRNWRLADVEQIAEENLGYSFFMV